MPSIQPFKSLNSFNTFKRKAHPLCSVAVRILLFSVGTSLSSNAFALDAWKCLAWATEGEAPSTVWAAKDSLDDVSGLVLFHHAQPDPDANPSEAPVLSATAKVTSVQPTDSTVHFTPKKHSFVLADPAPQESTFVVTIQPKSCGRGSCDMQNLFEMTARGAWTSPLGKALYSCNSL